MILVQKAGIYVCLGLEIDVKSANGGACVLADVGNRRVIKAVLSKELLCGVDEDVHLLLANFCFWGSVALGGDFGFHKILGSC